MEERTCRMPVGALGALFGAILAAMGLLSALRPLRGVSGLVPWALSGSLIGAGALLAYGSASRVREERLHRSHVRTADRLASLGSVERARILREVAREGSERFAW